MGVKTLKTNERATQQQGAKTARRNSSGRVASDLKTTRSGRVILKSSGASRKRDTQEMEQLIPQLAEAATTQAYRRALDAGNSVLIAEGGHLKEVSPDGVKRIIRQLEPSVKMRKGQIIKIK